MLYIYFLLCQAAAATLLLYPPGNSKLAALLALPDSWWHVGWGCRRPGKSATCGWVGQGIAAAVSSVSCVDYHNAVWESCCYVCTCVDVSADVEKDQSLRMSDTMAKISQLMTEQRTASTCMSQSQSQLSVRAVCLSVYLKLRTERRNWMARFSFWQTDRWASRAIEPVGHWLMHT